MQYNLKAAWINPKERRNGGTSLLSDVSFTIGIILKRQNTHQWIFRWWIYDNNFKFIWKDRILQKPSNTRLRFWRSWSQGLAVALYINKRFWLGVIPLSLQSYFSCYIFILSLILKANIPNILFSFYFPCNSVRWVGMKDSD